MKHGELIATLSDCAIRCRHCANECLSEEDVRMMAECIRNDILCADVCDITGRVLIAFDTLDEDATALVAFCRSLCERCALECSRHEHDHCRACAASCKKCMEACSVYLD